MNTHTTHTQSIIKGWEDFGREKKPIRICFWKWKWGCREKRQIIDDTNKYSLLESWSINLIRASIKLSINLIMKQINGLTGIGYMSLLAGWFVFVCIAGRQIERYRMGFEWQKQERKSCVFASADGSKFGHERSGQTYRIVCQTLILIIVVRAIQVVIYVFNISGFLGETNIFAHIAVLFYPNNKHVCRAAWLLYNSTCAAAVCMCHERNVCLSFRLLAVSLSNWLPEHSYMWHRHSCYKSNTITIKKKTNT